MGCLMAVPPRTDNYAGHWMDVEKKGYEVIFDENGKIMYRCPDYDYTGYIIRWWEHDRTTWAFTTNTMCCCCCPGKSFLVQKEPVEESGNWKQQTATKQFVAESKWRMILEKITYVKIGNETK